MESKSLTSSEVTAQPWVPSQSLLSLLFVHNDYERLLPTTFIFPSSGYKLCRHPPNEAQFNPHSTPITTTSGAFQILEDTTLLLAWRPSIIAFFQIFPRMILTCSRPQFDFTSLKRYFWIFPNYISPSIPFFSLIASCFYFRSPSHNLPLHRRVRTHTQVFRGGLSHLYTVRSKWLAVLHTIFDFCLPNIHWIGILIFI